MRPKIIFSILLVAAVVLAVAVTFSKKSQPQPTPVPVATTVPVAVTTPAPKPAVAVAPAPAIVTNNSGTNTAEQKELAHEEYVQKRSDEFMSLAALKDPKGHQKIVNALYDSDREIRKAALDALEQTDDRSVIPDMQKVADQTEDPDDKQAIEDAIDFIKLPSLTEYLKAKKAAKVAGGTQPQNGSSHP